MRENFSKYNMKKAVGYMIVINHVLKIKEKPGTTQRFFYLYVIHCIIYEYENR